MEITNETLKMKRYDTYKDSGIEWIGEVPEHWEIKKLKFVTNCLNTIRVPLNSEERGQMVDRIYDYYGASGIIDKVESFLFEEDLILIGEDGANLLTRSKRLAFIASGQYWVNNHAHILKPKKGNIHYLCEMLELIDYSIYVSGSAQPKLTQEALLSIDIVDPPEGEQAQIARYLDYKIGQIDKLIADKQKLIELLNEERTAMINQAVTKGLNPDVPMKDSGIEWLGEIPAHWEIGKLKFFCDLITDGSHFSPLSLESGRRYISVKDVKDNFIDFENCKYISDEDFVSLEKNGCRPFKNDILLTKDGTIGRASIVGEDNDFVILSSLAIIRAKTDFFYAEYLKEFLVSNINIDQMISGLQGSALTRITLTIINKLYILVPPKTEQLKLLEFISKQSSRIDELQFKTIQEIDLLKEYKTALISEVVTGKVDVREEIIANAQLA